MTEIRNVKGVVKVGFEENNNKGAWAIGWVRTYGLHKKVWIAMDNQPVHTLDQAFKVAGEKSDADLLAEWEWDEQYYEWALIK